jgi:hypothetical protein
LRAVIGCGKVSQVARLERRTAETQRYFCVVTLDPTIDIEQSLPRVGADEEVGHAIEPEADDERRVADT